MSFIQSELAFLPGLFANRSKRGSKTRWVDGNLVRFMDGVPAQMGGWTAKAHTGIAIAGSARGIIGWRPNSQNGRFAAIGSDQGAFLYDGDNVSSITPAGFVAGLGGTILGAGYGSDRFGVGTYGTERESTGNLLDASNWTFDMFGETLLGCFSTDGILYEYTDGADAALTAIVGAPTARAICVSDERHVFAFGADGVPGRVKWSDRENYRVWDALETNRSGSYDLQVTSPFQCGKRVRGQILGWTKTEVFAFAPLFNASVYSRERISTDAGCVGPQACTVVTDNTGETAYWFGRNDFFFYDGFVHTLPCELHDFVFNDVNLLQGAKFEARTNSAFKEVWFWYCSAGSAEVDRAVVYNYGNQSWTKALISRLCWLDAGIFDKPLAIDAAGAIFEHESGVTANGATMGSYVSSHPITVGVGQQFAEVDQFWPDMQEDSSSCKVSFLCRDTPGGATSTIGPYVFNVGDSFVPLAFSTREFQLRIDGNGGKWELGVPLISMQGGSLR